LLYTRFFEFFQERLYLVLKAIVAQKPDVTLMVVGKGRHGEEKSLLQASQEMGFADNLLMVGWTDPDQIPDYLAAANVAIYPLEDNLVNRAKCPAKLTEILNAGCPVVADAVGQATEYIRAGETGLLCSPDKPDEMASKVVYLLENKGYARTLGEAARRHLQSEFAWQSMAGQLDDFYKKCIEG